MLIIIHTAYFLYLHFQDFHRKVPDPNWAQIPFAGLVLLVTLLQLAAFVKTWRTKRGSRRMPTSRVHNTNTIAPPVSPDPR
jgi:sulfoxide reductase heme-binding subunit YedZ